MIIEVFKKGSNFKEFLKIIHGVKFIDNSHDSEIISLKLEDDSRNIVLNAKMVELRITI